MHTATLCFLVISCAHPGVPEQLQCSKDDLGCSEGEEGSRLAEEALYNNYKQRDITSWEDFKIREALDKIDEIKAADPESALKLAQGVLSEHPESPRALQALTRIYRSLYARLSAENKKIGRIEYVTKMFEVLMKLLTMDREKVPFLLYQDIADYSLGITEAFGENEWAIKMARELVFGSRRQEFNAEDKEFHFQILLDETFLSGDFETCKDLIIQNTVNSSMASMSMRFMMAIIVRLEEQKTKLDVPFKRYNELMINQTMPDGQAERDELFVYSSELEKALRRLDKQEELTIMYDLLSELQLYPSRYQRPIHHMKGLTAKPIWTLEETGYEDKLYQLEANWEKIRDEALSLVEVTPQQNITMGEKDLDLHRKWKQFMFHGFGSPSFPDWMCEHTPTICSLLKDYPFATKCPLGTIKLSVVDAGAHILPHVSSNNFRLRAHLPLVVPKLNLTETKEMARMVVASKHKLVWEEGKIIVFDDSFEHEVFNLTGQPRVLLIIDLIHPEMTQAQFQELEKMFSFVEHTNDPASGPMAVLAEQVGQVLGKA